jgi:hypothetical protein
VWWGDVRVAKAEEKLQAALLAIESVKQAEVIESLELARARGQAEKARALVDALNAGVDEATRRVVDETRSRVQQVLEDGVVSNEWVK